MLNNINLFEEQLYSVFSEKADRFIKHKMENWINNLSAEENDKELSSLMFSYNLPKLYNFLNKYCQSIGLILHTPFFWDNRRKWNVSFQDHQFSLEIHNNSATPHGWDFQFLFWGRGYNLPNNYSFLCSFLRNVLQDSNELDQFIKQLTDSFKKKSKIKEMTIKSMAVLIEETLSKMNYAWELIVHKNTVHKLKIQITNNRIISLDIREKDFVQYIQKIPEFVDKLICLEKTYNMEIAIQSFIPNNNKALSNTYKLII